MTRLAALSEGVTREHCELWMAAPDDLSVELPGDPAVLRERLCDGTTFFFRPNKKPAQRAELRLCVAAGSVLEEEHERGIAHVLEHLAFRETERYDNFALVKFLESIGAPFGACQNAYTSFDETVYQLRIPLDPCDDQLSIFTQTLEVLHQWAFGVRVSSAGLDSERGVVLDEWRQSKNSSGRASEAYWKSLMDGSIYADRMPIGTECVVRDCTAEQVQCHT